MSPPRFLSPDQIEKAKALRAEGLSLSFIGRVMGVNRMTIKYWTEGQQYRLRLSEQQGILSHYRNARKREKQEPQEEPERISVAEWRRLIRAIPEDTRDLTSRICEDPLPGRSALDRRARV